MDKQKSKFYNQKSLNTTYTKIHHDKKHNSDEVSLLKKRGVYVESKRTTESNSAQTDIMKPPKRPSRDQKVFIAPALNLLSKSFTASSSENINGKISNAKNYDGPKDKVILPPPKIDKKKKYKSKILNKIEESDRIEVLQPKKQIVHTPSIISDQERDEDFSKIKWSEFLPRLVKTDDEINERKQIEEEKRKKRRHLEKEVFEGRMTQHKTTVEDPPTLVAEETSKKEGGLYDFFVDLLETTLSVYNVEENKTKNVGSELSSKVCFHMDENIAKKLNMKNKQLPPTSSFQYPKHEQLWSQDYNTNLKDNEVNKRFTQKLKPRNIFISEPRFPRQRRPAMQSTQKSNKQNYKSNLLNMLKKQLKIANATYEEPSTLYDALKVIAKTNKKAEKTLTYEDWKTIEMVKKTRKSTKKMKRNRKPKTKQELGGDIREYTSTRGRNIRSIHHKVSNLSLVVYNADSECPIPNKTKPEDVQVTYHSSSESVVEKKNDPPIEMQQILMTVQTVCSNRHESSEFLTEYEFSTDFSD